MEQKCGGIDELTVGLGELYDTWALFPKLSK